MPVTRFAYDLLERRIRTVDPMGRTTTYAYDAVSRPTKAFNLAVQATPLAQQTFTANGQRASLSDALGHTTTYAWDGFDRLSTTTWPDSTSETLGYDADGNVVSRSTRAGPSISYTYDTLNRLVTKTPPSPEPVATYTYDLAGRMTSASDNSAAVASITIGGSNLPYTATTAYDALNRPTGVSWTPAPAATPPSSGTLVTFNYAYNAVNQRIGETASDSSWLGYPSGTGTTAYTANNLNQYTAVGGVTPAYDNNGNLTSDGTATLTYDSENRLVAATSGGNTATYAFDARGRRKLRTVNGTSTITITGADDRPLLDYDGTTGAVLRWYANGPGPNAVLGQMNVGAGTRDTLLPDTLGSVIASVDGGGTVTKFGYQPFGQSSATPPQFGYTGQRPDQETGLYYYRARHYSPAWGRFTQPDPIGYQGGANLYGYVYNDPLNLLDPEGLAALNAIQAGLTVASFCPSVCGSVFSLIDAGISAGRGDYVGAGISLGAAGLGIFSDAGAVKMAAVGGIAAANSLKAATHTPIRWGPATGAGPLGESIAGTFRGGSYTEMVTSEATTLYRAYGGSATELGSYWTRTAPAGPLQARIDSAMLPAWGNTATSVSSIRVPTGTRIYDGFAAPQGNLLGGGSQVFVPKVHPSWLVR